ncbi:MAG: hypothetical protein JXQ73_21985, partial [Phycisphaerae bacterium]|nr:hypothetical protein [Phycisphaerae bacterium]
THDPNYPSAKPHLIARLIDGPFELDGKPIIPVPLLHGEMPILGFRFGDFAYCTDCSAVPPESMALLADLDVLVLDALRRRSHPTHFNLEQAVECAGRIRAKRTLFTHIAHELMHEPTNQELPDGMALAHDGLQLILDEAALGNAWQDAKAESTDHPFDPERARERKPAPARRPPPL